MNTEDIINLALAGKQNLKDRIYLAIALEREQCAKAAAWILKMPENDVSAAIRARGQG